MDEQEYCDIFYYITKKKRPEDLSGKKNKNKWKCFKKKCKNYRVIFSQKIQARTLETGTLFRKCWSPKLQRHLQKIVIMEDDFVNI